MFPETNRLTPKNYSNDTENQSTNSFKDKLVSVSPYRKETTLKLAPSQPVDNSNYTLLVNNSIFSRKDDDWKKEKDPSNLNTESVQQFDCQKTDIQKKLKEEENPSNLDIKSVQQFDHQKTDIQKKLKEEENLSNLNTKSVQQFDCQKTDIQKKSPDTGQHVQKTFSKDTLVNIQNSSSSIKEAKNINFFYEDVKTIREFINGCDIEIVKKVQKYVDYLKSDLESLSASVRPKGMDDDRLLSLTVLHRKLEDELVIKEVMRYSRDLYKKSFFSCGSHNIAYYQKKLAFLYLINQDISSDLLLQMINTNDMAILVFVAIHSPKFFLSLDISEENLHIFALIYKEHATESVRQYIKSKCLLKAPHLSQLLLYICDLSLKEILEQIIQQIIDKEMFALKEYQKVNPKINLRNCEQDLKLLIYDLSSSLEDIGRNKFSDLKRQKQYIYILYCLVGLPWRFDSNFGLLQNGNDCYLFVENYNKSHPNHSSSSNVYCRTFNYLPKMCSEYNGYDEFMLGLN